MKSWAAATVWIALAAGSAAMVAQTAGTGTQQQAIPDSPRPQLVPGTQQVAPGKGAPAVTAQPPAADSQTGPAPSATLPSAPAAAPQSDDPAPDIKPVLGAGGRVEDIPLKDDAPEDSKITLRRTVNFVQIPFTVKDKSGALVPAIDWREVRVFENGSRKQIRLFTSDPYPLSVAFVVDQSLPFDVMKRVNSALGAVQGAFTPYDEMAIFTYNNGPRLRTDYTGAQSARVSAVLEQSKSTGREAQLYTPDGPLSQTTNINGQSFDPNTAPNRGCPSCTFQAPPKETHTLNDAIYMAAQSLSKRPDNRRRVIYVVSDGKELGSTAKYKDVVKYLQQYKIAVYATVVGDSATKYIGWLDHYHLPFEMNGNILPKYALATGGEAISEYRIKGIETSFAKIAEDVRVQYTVGYYSNEPITDGKFRSVEVKVLRPGLDVVAKSGYYPTPESTMRTGTRVTAQPASSTPQQ